MRMFFMILALTLALPVHAGHAGAGAKAKKEKREPANRMPSRVLNFVCRENPDSAESAIGMVNMSVDLRDATVGAFGMSLFIKKDKGYLPKTLNGTYTTVPGGYVLRAKWQGIFSDFVLIHVHPNDKTAFPGMEAKLGCEITGELESL